MFPKNKIDIIYRLLCLICYILVIIFANSRTTILVLLFLYGFLALTEVNFRNIEFIIMTVVILGICYLLNSYLLLRIMLLIDYSVYFLDTSYYVVDEIEEIKINKKDYVRFANKKIEKKKGTNNTTALYLTVHLVVLFLAIMVG